MTIKLTNYKIENYLMQLQPFLDHKTKIGYVAARNIRTFSNMLQEFFLKKDEIINKYGEIDEEQKGERVLYSTSPNFKKAVEELNEYGNLIQEVNIMTIKEEEAIGELSGNDFLALEWLFTPEEKTEE